jgi:hypothetical protein
MGRVAVFTITATTWSLWQGMLHPPISEPRDSLYCASKYNTDSLAIECSNGNGHMAHCFAKEGL